MLGKVSSGAGDKSTPEEQIAGILSTPSGAEIKSTPSGVKSGVVSTSDAKAINGTVSVGASDDEEEVAAPSTPELPDGIPTTGTCTDGEGLTFTLHLIQHEPDCTCAGRNAITSGRTQGRSTDDLLPG